MTDPRNPGSGDDPYANQGQGQGQGHGQSQGHGDAGGYGYPPVGGGPQQAYFPPPGYPQPGAYPPPGAYPQQFQPVPQTNGMAIAALIVSLVSCGPIGLILGIISLRQLKTSGEQGRGMALAGTIIGAIGTLFWIAFVVLLIATVSVSGELTSGDYIY